MIENRANSTPRTLVQKLWHHSLPYETGLALAALALVIWTCIHSNQKDAIDKKVTIVCGSFVFIFTVLKNLAGWGKTLKNESHYELAGCLQTLHSIMLSNNAAVLRITIHVPVNKGEQLEQVMNYIGENPERTTVGRRIPSQSGIAGAAFRRKEALQGERVHDDHAAFVAELVKDWSYTQSDAEQCNPAAKSWLAIPLVGTDGTVEGIIFFDCSERAFFTDDRKQIALNAAAGIAKFVRKRY